MAPNMTLRTRSPSPHPAHSPWWLVFTQISSLLEGFPAPLVSHCLALLTSSDARRSHSARGGSSSPGPPPGPQTDPASPHVQVARGAQSCPNSAEGRMLALMGPGVPAAQEPFMAVVTLHPYRCARFSLVLCGAGSLSMFLVQ